MPALWIHVQQHRAERPDVGRVEPVGQRAQSGACRRTDRRETRPDRRQAPVAVGVFALQPVQPVHAEPRGLVAALCGPERHIRLIGQIFGRAIGAVVVDDDRNGRRPDRGNTQGNRAGAPFRCAVSKRAKCRRADLRGAVDDGFQLQTFSEGARARRLRAKRILYDPRHPIFSLLFRRLFASTVDRDPLLQSHGNGLHIFLVATC